jgi:hypothetical protein
VPDITANTCNTDERYRTFYQQNQHNEVINGCCRYLYRVSYDVARTRRSSLTLRTIQISK